MSVDMGECLVCELSAVLVRVDMEKPDMVLASAVVAPLGVRLGEAFRLMADEFMLSSLKVASSSFFESKSSGM